jgi:Protein of unknown function (DUF3795)
MEPILTRCGYRCDLCLAYRPNVEKNSENQHKLSDGWFKYFGFRIPAENIACDGCMEGDPKLIDQACPVRPCAMERGISSCAACELYVCDKLQERIVEFDEIKNRMSGVVPEDEYISFIQPYENKRRLDHYRATGEVVG